MSDSQGAAGCPTARCERLDSCATTKPSCQHTSREHRQSSTASWPHADLSGGPRMVRARLVSSYQAAEAQESCPSSIMDHIIAAVAGAQTQSLRACAPGSSSTLRPAPLSHSGRWSRPPPCENGAAGRFVRPQGAIQFAYLGHSSPVQAGSIVNLLGLSTAERALPPALGVHTAFPYTNIAYRWSLAN